MNKEKVVTINDREPTKMEMLDQWMKELVYPAKVSDFIEEVSGQGNHKHVVRKICFYTEEHKYFITAVSKSDGDSYLGCGVEARKIRPGEGWVRGNDLPDGPFTRKTWDMILNSIVSYELVKLSDYQKPSTVPEDIA
jgi:hypothetical protein